MNHSTCRLGKWKLIPLWWTRWVIRLCWLANSTVSWAKAELLQIHCVVIGWFEFKISQWCDLCVPIGWEKNEKISRSSMGEREVNI